MIVIKYQDKNKDTVYDGKLVLYKNYIMSSTSSDFITIMKRLASKYKVKATDVMSESIRLLYKRNQNEIIVTENSLVDKVRLSQTKRESFGLIRKALLTS